MDIEILELTTEHDQYIKKGSRIWDHPNYFALEGQLKPLQRWCKVIKQDWRERMFRLMWVYMFIKKEGQTRPIDVDKNFRIITGHKRASAMLVLGHKTIKVNIIDYEKIGQK